jgi:hypothetical protein
LLGTRKSREKSSFSERDDDAGEEFDGELIDEGDIHEPKIQKARKRCVVM